MNRGLQREVGTSTQILGHLRMDFDLIHRRGDSRYFKNSLRFENVEVGET